MVAMVGRLKKESVAHSTNCGGRFGAPSFELKEYVCEARIFLDAL